MGDVFQFKAPNINGEQIDLTHYRGQVLLIVNTACKCDLTPQYVGLEKLYQKYKNEGFKILAFPCAQFSPLEPKTDVEIKNFCQKQFNISFDIFAKVEVNGPNSLPLFNYLKQQCRGLSGPRAIKWNFTKFLVNRDGKVVNRYAPRTKPEAISDAIENIL